MWTCTNDAVITHWSCLDSVSTTWTPGQCWYWPLTCDHSLHSTRDTFVSCLRYQTKQLINQIHSTWTTTHTIYRVFIRTVSFHCTALIVVTSFSGDQWVIVHHQIVVTCYSLMWSHIPRIKLTVTTCNLHVQISVFVLQLRINRLQSDWSAYQIQWPQLGCLWL